MGSGLHTIIGHTIITHLLTMAPHANGVNAHTNGSRANEIFMVDSPHVTYTQNEIKSMYTYRTTKVAKNANGGYLAQPVSTVYEFKTDRTVPKTGLMLVGWGGNNGSTVTAGIIANRNKLSWESREGKKYSNYYGSVIMSSTIKLGTDETGKEIYIPFHDMLPMLHPNDLILGGWDISSMNLADAMDRAAVLEPDLKRQVREEMSKMHPLPSVYYPDFIAANQGDRADNVLSGTKAEHVQTIRSDIRFVLPKRAFVRLMTDKYIEISRRAMGLIK